MGRIDAYRSGNFISCEPGKGLCLAEGKNARMGQVQLKQGKAFVKTAVVTSQSRIFLTLQTMSASSGFVGISLLKPGLGFGIQSSSVCDQSEVAWIVVEPTEG